MYLEDYQVQIFEDTIRWNQKPISFQGAVEKHLNHRGSMYKGAPPPISYYKICFGELDSIRLKLITTNIETILIEIGISYGNLKSTRVHSFLSDLIKSNGYPLIWKCQKATAIELGIWSQIKAQNQKDPKIQELYIKAKSRGFSFASKTLSGYHKGNLSTKIEAFLYSYILPLVGTDDRKAIRFAKDFNVKISKLKSNHSKEQVSKFIKFLNACPEDYTEYRKNNFSSGSSAD